MSTIVWSFAKKDSENEQNFQKIADWWYSLKGKKIQECFRNGLQTNHNTGTQQTKGYTHETITLINPELFKDTLTLTSPTLVLGTQESINENIKRLVLCEEQQLLKVYTSDSDTIPKYVFKDSANSISSSELADLFR